MIGRRQLLRYGAAAGTSLLLPRYGLIRPRRAHAATTFNVHYNLLAWAAGAKTLGQRFSSSGNAYQCIVPGTNTAAPTGTSADATFGGTAHFKYLSAIDYVSLQEWANNMPGTQSVDYIVQLWNNGIITTTPSEQFLGYAADAGSFSTLITCAPGEGLIGNRSSPLTAAPENGVKFVAPDSGTQTFPYFTILTNNVTFRGIQYHDPQSAYNIGFATLNDSLRFEGCILDAWSILYTAGYGTGLVNCLAVSREVGNTGNWSMLWDSPSAGSYVVNCTVIQAGDGGSGAMVVHLGPDANAGIVRNSGFFGTLTPVMSQNAPDVWVIDHCGFDVSSGEEFSTPTYGYANTDGGSNLFSLSAADQFIDPATNFQLKSGSSLINAGTTDLTNLPAANDIYGFMRTGAWDIGAQEFAAGGGGGLLPLLGVG